MTKLLGVLVVAMTACADDEPAATDPHRVIACDGGTLDGVPITMCEAACDPFPRYDAVSCVLADGRSTAISFTWSGRQGFCSVDDEAYVTRFIECVD